MDDLDCLNLEQAFQGMLAASFDDTSGLAEVQVKEMRRAFFGGVKVAIDILEETQMDMDDIRDECRIFVQAVKAGRR